MNKFVSAALAGTTALALAACGTAEDASVDAEAENVETAADAAVTDVAEVPAADAAVEGATEEAGAETTAAVAAEADEAATGAEAAANDVMAEVKKAGEEKAKEEGQKLLDKGVEAAKKELGN